jgi:hypothetical protein
MIETSTVLSITVYSRRLFVAGLVAALAALVFTFLAIEGPAELWIAVPLLLWAAGWLIAIARDDPNAADIT